MVYRITLLLLLVTAPGMYLHADNLEGNDLYRVTTVRAAPGKLSQLIEVFRQAAATRRGATQNSGPMLMRHSQGDQWDLLVITPMESFAAYFDVKPTQLPPGILAGSEDLIAFEDDVFALGPASDAVRAAYDQNSLYHIEMFEAVAGKIDALAEQRRMENRYLVATGQVPNMIFRRVAGSDVDIFTIGFHKSLEAFAAPAPASDAEKEIAATDAGFRDRADLSFFLRSLISGHHDTFAVKVD